MLFRSYVGIGMMRQQLMPGVSVMSLIMEPNRDDGFIPDHSWVRVKIRAFSERAIADAVKKLKCCIKAAVDAAGCCFKLTEKAGYKGRVVNKTIGDLLHANLNLLKEPTMEGYVDDNGGEDFGNLSRVIPGMMVYPTLYPEKKLSNHTEFFMELANSDRSKHVLLLGSKVLAFTAVDLLCSVDIIKQAKRELSLLMESGES